MRRFCIVGVLLVLSGCGRYFAGPLQPADQQTVDMTINDDGSLTYTLERLEVSLRPMTDAQLNRQFAGSSERGARSTNPYTFGDWSPMGDEWTPPRFTVFALSVKNYQFPKVLVNPRRMYITTDNNRRYQAMSFAQLDEYYRAYWVGRTGRGRGDFRNRTDLLRRTLYTSEAVFSGQEKQGYVVFPVLHDDVKGLQVHVEDIALRFDYADQPVETTQLVFAFERQVFQGYSPPVELVEQR